MPQRALVRLPDHVDFDTSAALTLAGSTAMHMLTNRATVRPGDWALVIGGASGVGSAAIQIARELGARVISTGSTEAKRTLAKQLGAEFVVDSNAANWAGEVRKITSKRGVDLVVEHVGGEVLVKCFDCLARGGTIVTCGATAGRELTVEPLAVLREAAAAHRQLRTQPRRHGRDARLGRRRKIATGHRRRFPLHQTAEAFAMLRARRVLGKVLVEPFEPVSESD